jgi:1,4-dihydroxy-2-naphthoate octaprenyltransferase
VVRPAWCETIAVWLQALRYRSLAIATMAVLAGIAAAWHDGFASWRVLLAWLGAVAAQAGTNLTNVHYNYKATRTPDPRGSSAVLAHRLLSPEQVRRGGYACFGVAVATGIALTALTDWRVLLLGIPGLLAGYFYSAPPVRLGYLAFGVVTVFAFFGPVMVAGTYFVAAGGVSPLAFAVALPVGLTAAAIMHVNDLRDFDGDLAHGKRTLATVLGARAAAGALLAINAAAYLLIAAGVAAGLLPWTTLTVLLSLPTAVRQFQLVSSDASFDARNRAWFAGVRLHSQFGALLIMGLVAGRLLGV